jgi:microsomal dipeptidase-like Zn-dependent dipeptidase
MPKIVINNAYGGFQLSDANIERYAAIKGIVLYKKETRYYTHWHREADMSNFQVWPDASFFSKYDVERDDPALVQVVEEMLHSGEVTDLRVVEIPNDVEWEIKEYDGFEHVAEVHRTWHALMDEASRG